MTAVFKGIGNLLGAFLEIPYGIAIALVFVIVVVVGGFISVVRTDVLQGILMFAAAGLLFNGTVRAAGGIGTLLLWKTLPFAAGIHEVFPALLLSSLAYLVVSGCSPAHGAEEVQQLFRKSPEI